MAVFIKAASMGGNKSTKLISVRNQYDILRREYAAFNYVFDRRYGEGCITSHAGSKVPAISVFSTQEMKEYLRARNFFMNLSQGKRKKGVIVEEAQFSDEDFVPFLEENKDNFDFHIGMLLKDYGARLFRLRRLNGTFSDKTTLDIIALGDFVDMNLMDPAKCTYTYDNGERCGEDASETAKFIRLRGEKLWIPAPYDPDHVIEPGGVGSDLVEEKKDEEKPYEVIYRPRDRNHFVTPPFFQWKNEEELVDYLKRFYAEGKGLFIATQAL